MSEDRNKHDRAGDGGGTLGHRVGRSREARSTEGKAGMSQHVPDSVRERIARGDKPKGESK